MAIQTGQGIGAAQVVGGNVGVVDISGFTNAIYQEAKRKREEQAAQKEQALKDAADLYKKRSELAAGKTPAFTQMGKNSLAKLDDQLRNGEINEQQYKAGLDELANTRDYLEKTAQEMSKQTDGYVYDSEEGRWRIGNPSIDFITSSNVDYGIGDFNISEIAKLGTPDLNPNFLQNPRVDLRKKYDTYAKDLLATQNPAYETFDIGDDRIASEIRKQAKVDNVIDVLMSEDEAIRELLYRYQVNGNHSPEEAQALLENDDDLRAEFKRQLGLGDLEFIQDVQSSVTNKPQERKDGGGSNQVIIDDKLAKEVKEETEGYDDIVMTEQGITVLKPNSKTAEQVITIPFGSSQKSGTAKGVRKRPDGTIEIRVDYRENGKTESGYADIEEIREQLTEEQYNALLNSVKEPSTSFNIDRFIEDVKSMSIFDWNKSDVAQQLGNYYSQLKNITDPNDGFGNRKDIQFEYNGKTMSYNLDDDIEREEFKSFLDGLGTQEKIDGETNLTGGNVR